MKRQFSYSAIDNFIMEKHPQGSRTVVCEIAPGANELINKKLIANAPALLRSLELLVSTIDCACAGPVKSGKCTVCKAKLAIAKAKGE